MVATRSRVLEHDRHFVADLQAVVLGRVLVHGDRVDAKVVR
jgi:hypothetical protein